MVERARLESECAFAGTVGSNPTLSSICMFTTKFVVLDGEVAVPCNPQSAIAGLMSGRGFSFVKRSVVSGVEDRVLRDQAS